MSSYNRPGKQGEAKWGAEMASTDESWHMASERLLLALLICTFTFTALGLEE